MSNPRNRVLSGLKLILQANTTERSKLKLAVNWLYRLYYDVAKFDNEIARIVKSCPLRLEGYSERELYNWYMLMRDVWDAIVNPHIYRNGEPPAENAEVFRLANEMCTRIKALQKRMDRDFNWLKHQDPFLFEKLVDTVGFFIDSRARVLSIAKEVAGLYMYDSILSERYSKHGRGSIYSASEENLTNFLHSLEPLGTDQINSILESVKKYITAYEEEEKVITREMELALEQANFEFLTIEEYDEILKAREDRGTNIIVDIGEIMVKSEVGREKAEKTKPRVITKPTVAKSTILFLAADPTDTSRLRLGQECREIQEKLQLARMRNKFSLVQRLSVRPADISQAILDVKPRIIHFSGHGQHIGELCFEDELGQAKSVSTDALAALFELVSDQVDCVLLNACYSVRQARAIAAHINYVIGMEEAIGDKAAISFTVGFYQALGAGKSIEEAHKFGCVQIRLQGISGYSIPRLLKKNDE